MCQDINLTSVPSVGHKTKTIKTPCGWCKMSLASHWCCVRLKILKQAWIFSASHTITPPGSCIHRKAINKDKPSLSSGVLPSRQQSCVSRLPGTPPSLVYQVTHGTALQAAERYVQPLVLWGCALEDCPMQGKTVYSCLSPWRGWWPSVRKVVVCFWFGR